jgi:hypothetical protein
MFATALVVGEWRSLLGAFLVLTAHVLKARKEECWLMEQFGQDYENYRRETGFLLPRVREAQCNKQNGRADPLPFHETGYSYFLLTAFLSSAPAVNFATLRAAILIVAPVCGLRPFRAFL